MRFELKELVDLRLLQQLQEKLNAIYSFPSAIIDNKGNILTAVAWQDICTQFHRKHPECEKECKKSDQYIYNHLNDSHPAVSYKCPHGLVDNAVPIVIDGHHVGNFFTGQFFLEKPDLEFFKQQAKKYGFDEKEYLDAVKKVPIWTQEKLNYYLDFITQFIEVIAGIGLQNLKSKEINKILEESESFNRSILKTTMDGFCMLDTKGKLLYVNEAYCLITGYEEKELLGMNIFDLEGSETPEEVNIRIENVIQNGRDRFFTKHKHKKGHVIDLEVGIQFQTDFGGRIVAFVRDITEKKQTEEGIRQRTAMFEALLNTTIDGILIINDNGRKVFQNKRTIELFDIPLEYANNIDDQYQLKYVTEQNIDPEKFVNKVMYLYNHPQESSEDIIELKSGKILHRYSAPVMGKDGHNYGRIWMFRDITEQKNAEKVLIASKEKAEESDRLKTAFIQNMSHEIRTPMNAIMGFSELLTKNFNNKPKLEHFSKIITQRCTDLLVIIEDLLDIAKIESGQLSINIDTFHLESLLDDLKLFFIEHQRKYGKQHINFSLKNECIPKVSSITTDMGKLKQILINLIGNAFKFTDNGSITAGCNYDENNQLVFYVSDTGIGILPEKQQVIFERFIQLKSTWDRNYGGTGLGLSIVKGLLDLLNGKIWLESTPGKGSTFYFTLPCVSEISHERIQDTVNVEKIEFDVKNKIILVVEDDIYNSTFIEEILSDNNLKYVCVNTGNKAVESAVSNHFDLILMDIGLPDLNGYEVIKKIKKHRPEAKIIAQTAYAGPEDKRRALESGCLDYISKPIKYNEFVAMLKKYL